MPQRNVATKALSELLGALSHADRIRIVEELRDSEKDVGTLAELLGATTVRVSQHLSVLRSHRLVLERREGRHVFYRLAQPPIARWLIGCMAFVAPDAQLAEELREGGSARRC